MSEAETEASGEVGTWRDGRTPRRRCSAKSSQTGLPCKRAPIEGGTVCGTHGGRAPAVKRAAKARLENASLMLAKELLGMATDDDLPPAVKLAAIKDALDRAGLNPRQALDVTHDVPRYEKLFDRIDRESIVIGSSEPPTVVDGEIVDTDGFVEFYDDGRTP